MLFKALAVAAAVGGAVAQRPMNTSICDYYTTALLKNNTAANQMTLLTLVVNTAVIGNYTTPNVGIMVPGILTPGMYNGTQVNLAPYFDGGYASTNMGGSSGVAQSFLDGGGAAPLKMSKPASDTTSNQYTLLTHLYEYFGTLLGCSMQGMSGYPAYDGDASMYETHKFMDLSYAEVSYFIEQVALSAASFGVAQSDLMVVGQALSSVFNVRCAPPVTIVPSQGMQLESICTDMTCPLAVNSSCSMYNTTIGEPMVANSTLVPNSTASSSGSAGASSTMGTATSSGSGAPTASKAGAATVGMSFAAVAGGFAALFL